MPQPIIEIILSELKVPFTPLYLRQVEREMPYGASLWAIGQILNRYGVDHTSLRVSNKEQIGRIPCPFTAQASGDCVVVTSVTDDEVKYRTSSGAFSAPLDTFKQAWTGTVMIVKASESSSEPNLKDHRREERSNRLQTVLSSLGLIVLLVGAAVAGRLSALSISLGLVYILGTWLSVLLLKKQLNINSTAADKICSLLNSAGCTDPHKSPGPGPLLFGIFDLSIAGIAFFGVNLVATLLSPQGLGGAVSIAVALALPLTLWSVAYQGFKRKSWCALCLLVMVCVWVAFVVMIVGGIYRDVILTLPLLGALAALAAAYWLIMSTLRYLSDYYTAAEKNKKENTSLRQIKFDSHIWDSLMRDSPETYPVEGEETSSIFFGNPDSELPLITIVGNPFCNPCGRMHSRLEPLIDAGFRIQYFFTYFNPDLAPVNKRIVETYMTEGEQATWRLLTDWYTNGHPKEHPFANPPEQEIPAETTQEIIDELIRHDKWTAKAGISATPTVLIDGKPLPAGYTVEDLIYLYT